MGRFALLLNRNTAGVPQTISGDWLPILTEIRQTYSKAQVNAGYVSQPGRIHIQIPFDLLVVPKVTPGSIVSARAIRTVKVNRHAVASVEQR